MMDVIQRNIERLIAAASGDMQERIEPMSEWKWRKLYKLAKQYDIGPWIADGLRAYEGDFFLQMPAELHQQLTALTGEKKPERLRRYRLQIDRSQGPMHHFKRESLRAYAMDLFENIKNIEE